MSLAARIGLNPKASPNVSRSVERGQGGATVPQVNMMRLAERLGGA